MGTQSCPSLPGDQAGDQEAPEEAEGGKLSWRTQGALPKRPEARPSPRRPGPCLNSPRLPGGPRGTRGLCPCGCSFCSEQLAWCLPVARGRMPTAGLTHRLGLAGVCSFVVVFRVTDWNLEHVLCVRTERG